MLRVRGDSMIEAGILDGDYVVAVQQTTAHNGDIVVAGIPGGEATSSTSPRPTDVVTLTPANPTMAADGRSTPTRSRSTAGSSP